MKKNGSIIIEVIAAIMILSLTTTFIISAIIQNEKILKERIVCEEVNRAVANLVNEIKYNTTREEIDKMLNEGNICLEYDQDFSKKLLNSQIQNFEKGNDIQVSKISDEGIGLRLKIVANIKHDDIEINVEKEFIKSWWMDEMYK